MEAPPRGTKGTTSTAPSRGCTPTWRRRSIRRTASTVTARAACSTPAPTRVSTARLWWPSACRSSRVGPAAAAMAPITARSSPSLTFTTHSSTSILGSRRWTSAWPCPSTTSPCPASPRWAGRPSSAGPSGPRSSGSARSGSPTISSSTSAVTAPPPATTAASTPSWPSPGSPGGPAQSAWGPSRFAVPFAPPPSWPRPWPPSTSSPAAGSPSAWAPAGTSPN